MTPGIQERGHDDDDNSSYAEDSEDEDNSSDNSTGTDSSDENDDDAHADTSRFAPAVPHLPTELPAFTFTAPRQEGPGFDAARREGVSRPRVHFPDPETTRLLADTARLTAASARLGAEQEMLLQRSRAAAQAMAEMRESMRRTREMDEELGGMGDGNE